MKIKNILLGVLLVSAVVDKVSEGIPGGKSSSPKSKAAVVATAQVVTADDLVVMHRYFKGTYYPLIEGLRERNRVSRDDVFNAYERDPFLDRGHDGGHGTFKHKILPLTFGVSAHNNGLVNVDERRGHHQAIQVYINVIGNFCLRFLGIHHSIKALDIMTPDEWEKAYRTKYNDATKAFNEMTSTDWNRLIIEEEASFEEYSRD